MNMKQVFKLMLASSVLFLIAMSVLPSYAMNSDSNANDGNNGFNYKCEIYKSAAIITWNQPLDSVYCFAYSKDHQSFFKTSGINNVNSRRTFVIPLENFKSADFPLSVRLLFYGPNINVTDSITITL